ncbi:MAG TPA: hypothetical protein VFD32_01120, partial [Dehalococcoidia bacterium]|nr:hypothetical protein [Dehalococcoidia bacterium]
PAIRSKNLLLYTAAWRQCLAESSAAMRVAGSPHTIVIAMLLGTIAVAVGNEARLRHNAVAQPATRTVWTQDVWLITDLEIQDATGASTNLVPALLAAIDAAPGEAADLGRGMSYTDGTGRTGDVVGGDGTLLNNISVHIGVLTTPSGRLLTMIATPDVTESQVNIDESSQIGIDLSGFRATDGSAAGTISYSFLQTLNPADPATEAGMDDVAIFAQRFLTGHFQVLGVPDANDDATAAVVSAAPLAASGGQADSDSYAQSAGRIWRWQPYPDPFIGGDPGIPPLPDIWPRGYGAVPPSQIKQDDAPVGYRFCVFGCTWHLSGSGTISTIANNGVGGIDAKISFYVFGNVGYETNYFFTVLITEGTTSDNMLTETYTGRGSASGCMADPARSAGVSDLTYNGHLRANGKLDHAWVTLSFRGEPSGRLICTKPSPTGGAGAIPIGGELQLPVLTDLGCHVTARIKNGTVNNPRPPVDLPVNPTDLLDYAFTCQDASSGVAQGALSVDLIIDRG